MAQNKKYLCISQPHMGKRDIMYTCFHAHNDQTEFIALTDSDTIWEQETLSELVSVMVGHDEYRERKNAKTMESVSERTSASGETGAKK